MYLRVEESPPDMSGFGIGLGIPGFCGAVVHELIKLFGIVSFAQASQKIPEIPAFLFQTFQHLGTVRIKTGVAG